MSYQIKCTIKLVLVNSKTPFTIHTCSALKASGYNNELQYTEKTVTKKRSRRRNVIWFNPPWNDEVSTNVAEKFLSMIDRHFPKGSALGNHFHRSTVKVSYSSMTNWPG